MSDTPRTDAAETHFSVGLVPMDFARQLERELNEAKRDIATATDVLTQCNKWAEEAKPLLERGGQMERERDQWKQCAEEFFKLIEDQKLVRNTDSDNDAQKFFVQANRIVKALSTFNQLKENKT